MAATRNLGVSAGIRALIAITVLLALMSPTAAAVGLQSLKIFGDGSEPEISGFVWYPCADAPSDIAIGPFHLSATRDCDVNGTGLPLIVISHGQAGNALGHRATAQMLADAGFVVAAINHPGDTSQDKGLTDTLAPFIQRPRDIQRLVDYLLGSWRGAGAIDPHRIGLFGFSRGGYTGLVVAGANPQFRRASQFCEARSDSLCEQLRAGTLPPLAHDSRIRAMVIADPLTIFFTPESLQAVRIPVQLWQSERGGAGVTPASVAAIVEEMPVRPDFRSVPGAQHFSFIGPCPEFFAQNAPECTDSPGFNREAFYRDFNHQVLQFFLDKLR